MKAKVKGVSESDKASMVSKSARGEVGGGERSRKEALFVQL